ncbi:FAD-dependent oxidoreductase [Pseudonocardia eucalypti]|uniref:FAD-dependent oxidoreductase n=1 Tax=Pseudonocardia eucalypti TaxID=648755 RepID=A0ABP9PEG3_9PSEU|nr:2-polyprenyl-6-methoxyphenol hydroxylase-like FAD-dependent oxidoreductase [Pseudonocardia eucalypti]
MNPWPHDPVIVLGNGPVGQTAALLLARWGVPTVLLDLRRSRDLVGSKAICQQRDVLDVWEAVGARVAAEGVTWDTARTYYRDTELFSVRMADAGRSPLPPFVNVSQSRTEQLLDQRIAGSPLIDVRWGHRVTEIDQDADGVWVSGPEFRLRAPFLLVCAGARADGLRAGLGVSFEGHSFEDRFLICDIRAELPDWARERRFYFDPVWNPGRQVLIHPCPGGEYRIDWQVPPDYDASALAADTASGALDQRIRQIVGDTAYEVTWSSVYRFHTRCVDRMRVGRVLLAGDAAHLYAPFGARGLNSGVADAENAAWKLAFAGWDGTEREALLESYHIERHAAARENVAVTSATMDFLVPQTAAEAAHRRDVLARASADSAEARARVNSGRLYEAYWYAESPLTTPDPTRPHPVRPPRGVAQAPAPGVLIPDLPLETGGRLREVCRDGLLVLVAPGGGPGAVRVAELAAEELAPVPARAVGMAELSAELPGVLGARGAEWWVVRPDAHIAAVVTDEAELRAALRRAIGHPGEPATHGAPVGPGESGESSKEGSDGVLPAAR